MMKLAEVFSFEVRYQARRPLTWVYFAVVLLLAWRITMEAYSGNARAGGYAFNSPFVIASITHFGSLVTLLVAAAMSGEAAARDVQTRMHPLIYASPLRTAQFLGGRFLAAFALCALIALAAQFALLVTVVMPGASRDLLGPFQPMGYVLAFLVIALPNAFVTTALGFSMAALSRRAAVAYLGAVLLFTGALFARIVVAEKLGYWTIAGLVDPIGLTPLSEITRATTALEKNTLAVMLDPSFLWGRLLWFGVACGMLVFTWIRFRFEHTVTRSWWTRRAEKETAGEMQPRAASVIVPAVARAFTPATRLRQFVEIAAQSFRQVAFSWGGVLLLGLSILHLAVTPQALTHFGVPLLPTTAEMTSFLGNDGEIIWLIIPVLTVFYVGELVWREREVGLSEISDAAPTGELTRFLGKFVGLALLFAAYQLLMMLASMLVQAQLGYYDFEPGLYARALFGLHLPKHLLFVVLAFAVHVVVNQKYAAHLILLIAWAMGMYGAQLGLSHRVLVYGSAPQWSYSDIRGFAPFVAPWAWFMSYWACWALLLAVATRLFWVRGRVYGVATRLATARLRLTRATVAVSAIGATFVVALAGFIVYNTTVLNAHETAADREAARVRYEREYGRFANDPQPLVSGVALRVEIHPERRTVSIAGRYRLVNASGVPIDSIHLEPSAYARTDSVTLDRPASLLLDDVALRHRVYALRTPLLPGDSLRLTFRLYSAPRGFTNDGADASVVANGTYIPATSWLPAIGYQEDREVAGAGARRQHSLPPKPLLPSLDDSAARHDMRRAARLSVETIIGTGADQYAMAPGALRRSWTDNGRRYFEYATDVPIGNDFAIYSAAYTVRDARWRPVATDTAGEVSVQVLHDPTHGMNADRIVRSLQASLDVYTRQFGPYPHRQIRLVERPGNGSGLHASAINISYEEQFSLFNAARDPRDLDFPFAVVAHEVAHQWWGHTLQPARVEGAALLGESLAWYSALSVVEETYGREHMDRLLAMLREAYLAPRARAGPPLLRAVDWFLAYRRGPFAMHALREYVGAERVNVALRRLIADHPTGKTPMATARDLYRELQAVTPDSLHPLLVDLFERNTYWELEARRVTAEPATEGMWRVSLDVRARKVTVDTAGSPTVVPMDDFVEIGVYETAQDGKRGAPLYLRMHRIRSGEQRITVVVPNVPGSAGIDPRHLLIDDEPYDNTTNVELTETVTSRR